MLVVLLSFAVVSMALSAVIFRVLFQRTQTVSPFELRYAEIDTRKYPRETVAFSSGDNVLRGYLYGTDEDAGGVVIVANGMRGDADSHLPEILYFVDNGWRVFSYDGTGVGNSEGDGIRGLSQSKLDLEAAIAFIRAHEATAALPVVLYGHSVGGYAAVTVLEERHDLAAVVCLAGFASPCETMRYHARQRVGILADIGYPFMRLQNSFLFGKDADASALDAINATSTPVVIVEAGGDTVVPKELGLVRFRDEIQNPNVTFLTVDEPYRDQHATMWFSEDAARYVAELRAYRENGGEPVVDKAKATELDGEFMSSLLLFYDRAVQK